MKAVEVEGLGEVVRDFSAAPAKAHGKMRAVTQVAAGKIKADAQRAVSGLAHAPHYPATITYDVEVTPKGVSAEIGPGRTGQGPLGPILEFGTVNNPPRPHLLPALEREVPVWIRFLEQVVGDV